MSVHVAGPLSVLACATHAPLVELGLAGARVGADALWARKGPAVLSWLTRVRARLGR